MKKIINILFCPQDAADTHEAIREAKAHIDAGEIVALEPEVNLISIECLTLLTSAGFKFSSISKRFIK